jgi:ATP-dependent Lon protease
MRGLEKLISTIASALAYQVEVNGLTSKTIDIAEIRKYLGSRKFEESDSVNYGEPGIVNGLAYVQYKGEGSSGDVLPIEVSYFPGKGKLKLTGNLGETMQESVEIALAYVKKNCSKFGISASFFEKNDILINVHQSGIPKDGPSAGIALTTAIISALTEKVVPRHYGMTGVISLSGKVSKIGGLNEKLTAAVKKELKTVFIPSDNERELEDVPLEIKNKLNVFYADDYFSSVWKRIS